jgi:hypothetical protein
MYLVSGLLDRSSDSHLSKSETGEREKREILGFFEKFTFFRSPVGS